MPSFKIFIFIIAATLFQGRYAVAQDADELVQKVRAKLDRVKDYQATGKMTVDISFIDMPPSKVKVYYKKPDKFRVKKDGGISILPKGGISVNMSTLLASGQFTVVPAKDAVLNNLTLRVVRLLPSDENGDVVLTTLYIEEASLVIRKAVVATRENGTYEIELSYGKYLDWGLPDLVVFSFNTKDFKVPKGITFEYEKGGAKKQEKIKNKKGKVSISYSGYTINKGVDDKVFTEK
jgi:outer membrane lipoprotein-sorting protein